MEQALATRALNGDRQLVGIDRLAAVAHLADRAFGETQLHQTMVVSQPTDQPTGQASESESSLCTHLTRCDVGHKRLGQRAYISQQLILCRLDKVVQRVLVAFVHQVPPLGINVLEQVVVRARTRHQKVLHKVQLLPEHLELPKAR